MQEVDENWKMKWKYVHYCKIMFTRWERDTHWRENDGSVGNLKAELDKSIEIGNSFKNYWADWTGP